MKAKGGRCHYLNNTVFVYMSKKRSVILVCNNASCVVSVRATMRRHIESGHRFSAFRERVGKPTDRGPQRRLVAPSELAFNRNLCSNRLSSGGCWTFFLDAVGASRHRVATEREKGKLAAGGAMKAASCKNVPAFRHLGALWFCARRFLRGQCAGNYAPSH